MMDSHGLLRRDKQGRQGIEVALYVMERLDCTKTLTLDMGGAEFRLLKELFSEVFW